MSALTIKLSTAAFFLGALGWAALSNAEETEQSVKWTNTSHCHAFKPYEPPVSNTKQNLKIIGVSMNSYGEIIRMTPKQDTLRTIPDNLGGRETAIWLTSLNTSDFSPVKEPLKSWMQTPLDVSSRADQDTNIAYVLLPKSWSYTEGQALSLKVPTKRWKHPLIALPKVAQSPKVAIIHRKKQIFLKEQKSCLYEFNLHITITQIDDGGKVLKTDIIIDPGLNNHEGPIKP